MRTGCACGYINALAENSRRGKFHGRALSPHLLMDAAGIFNGSFTSGLSELLVRKKSPALDRLWEFYDDPSVGMLPQHHPWFVYDNSFLANSWKIELAEHASKRQ